MAITKFLQTATEDEPKPVGGLVMTPEVFIKLVEVLDTNAEKILNGTEQVISSIPTKLGEVLRISTVTYHDHTGIDVRKYILSEETETPTRKGFRVPQTDYSDLMDSLFQMQDALETADPEDT